MIALLPDVLLDDYRTIVAELGNEPSDEQIVQALVTEADWTDRGAREVLQLAQTYGTAMLRNALALASALGIEDGDSGL